MRSSLNGHLQPSAMPAVIACLSLCMMGASWIPLLLPITEQTVWGYGGLLGLIVAVGLNQRNVEALMRHPVNDYLTELGTRHSMDTELKRELARATRYGESVSLIFADIDHFKRVNDKYGHASGDQVLKVVARLAQVLLRNCDSVWRYGGDEFVMLLPRSNRLGAAQAAERIRAGVESLKIGLPDIGKEASVRISISLGIANFAEDGDDAETLIRHADQALYMAKREGRNCVTTFRKDMLGNSTPCEQKRTKPQVAAQTNCTAVA